MAPEVEKDEPRKILIITPFFAPQTHAAVFRAYKLAKYLPDYGWQATVLTVDTNYKYNEDVGLLEGLPDEVEIVATPYVEPTARGVRMALGGRDRSFLTEKRRALDAVPDQAASPEVSAKTGGNIAPKVRNLYSWVRRNFLQVPDEYWTWFPTALARARQLHKERSFEVVYTTAPPFTSHMLGMAIQQMGPRWIADFRDPSIYERKVSAASDHKYLLQRLLIRETLQRADDLIYASSSYPLIYRDMFGDIREDFGHFIPTGVDEALIPDEPSPQRDFPYVVFSGEILPEYDDEFLAIFARALEHDDIRRRGLKLLVVGYREMNEPRLRPYIVEHDLEDFVEFVDHVPQEELYELLVSARAGVLNPGRTTRWSCAFAKMLDYIALRIPVLAVVPNPSEARTRLSEAGIGIFLDGDLDEAVETFVNFIRAEPPSSLGSPDVCDRFLAHRQVEDTVKVFKKALDL